MQRPTKAPMKCPIHVESLSNESSDQGEDVGGSYGPNDWIDALDACYDQETQIKICREHARYLNAMLTARVKKQKISRNGFETGMDLSE